jgi:hypothetical protein
MNSTSGRPQLAIDLSQLLLRRSTFLFGFSTPTAAGRRPPPGRPARPAAAGFAARPALLLLLEQRARCQECVLHCLGCLHGAAAAERATGNRMPALLPLSLLTRLGVSVPLLAAAAAATAAASLASALPTAPNILFVVVDDLGSNVRILHGSCTPCHSPSCPPQPYIG